MIRIGIYGYGNLGRGVESAIQQNKDMELCAVFTRRAPETVKIRTQGVAVCHINDIESYKDKIDVLILCGGSATDFRPVFEHVNRLQKEGAFTSLRGIVYFTDGMGIYPKKRPSYDAAFVLLEEPPLSVEMPPWAIRLVLELEGLEKAARETAEEYEIDLENLPQL